MSVSTESAWSNSTNNGKEISNLVSELGKTNINSTTETNDPDKSDNPSLADSSLLEKIFRKELNTGKYDLEVQRRDPNNPLFSVKSFEALKLHPDLLRGVYDMGFNAPSKIQETALPILMANPPQNMIAQSQSGTGKTAAFVLAMLSRVDTSKHYVQVLCLSPTYELAIQTGEVAAKMSQHRTDIELKFAVRGEEVPRDRKLTEHIVIGTPGKILDWSTKYKVFDLKKISVFVLDEADVMIATQGHQDQCIRIHKQLNNQCQMMFFSATYDSEVMAFAEMIVPNPTVIRLKREQESLDNIQQYYVRCADEDAKYEAITNIYGGISIGQAIIFCHTRKTAMWLARKMTDDGHSVAILSGELSVEQRISVLDRFRAGLQKVLITTNVLSRGIDIEQVTIVVNFDMPKDMESKADCQTYLHRIGRTGRFGKSGIALNLIDSEESMQICRDIEKHFGKKISQIDTDDAEAIEAIQSSG